MIRTRTAALRAAALPLAVIVAACGGAPAAPALTDPNEIIVKSFETLQGAKSVHLEVGLAGSLTADLFGTGTATEFPLDTTTLNGDLDLANDRARVTFDVPALLGLSGEVLVIGETSYVKTSLTGPLYQKSTNDGATEDVPSDPAEAIAELRTALEETEGLDPVKGADVACGEKQCYSVDLTLDPSLLSGLGEGAPIPVGELPADGSATVTFHVEKDTLRLAELIVAASAAGQGDITLTLTLTKWDEGVAIDEPQADQVTEGGGMFGG
ncbi:MAG TPA: hypothetical protein VFK54_05735 [Candidatus Limnocylindrales bacterium]|nr:hypothetical protein [Candidatus Limnocylindrales bacterium]